MTYEECNEQKFDQYKLLHEIEEEGLGGVSEIAAVNASRILKVISRIVSVDEPSVFPDEDGSLSIQFGRQQGAGVVLILLDKEGGGKVFSFVEGTHKKAKYQNALDLPDSFLIEQIEKCFIVKTNERYK